MWKVWRELEFASQRKGFFCASPEVKGCSLVLASVRNPDRFWAGLSSLGWAQKASGCAAGVAAKENQILFFWRDCQGHLEVGLECSAVFPAVRNTSLWTLPGGQATLPSRRGTSQPELTSEWVWNTAELTHFSNLRGTLVQNLVFYVFNVIYILLQPIYSEAFIEDACVQHLAQ